MRVEGPLGLAARQRTRAEPSVLRVLPPFKSRDEAELRINRARILEVGLRSAQGRGAGTEFDQLREYTPDDEFRRIDWSATARTGKLIVRTYRAERNQTVLLLLDSGRVMAGRVEGVPRLEHAMDAVMMMTAVSTRLGDRTGMLAFDRTVRAVVPPSGGRAQLGRITDAMYDLDAQLAESDYRAAFTEAMARFRRRALVVILTELTEPVIAETLLPALPVMVRHHLVLIGGVRDPDVVTWARDTPDDASEAYRKAAAVGAIEDRRRTIAAPPGHGRHRHRRHSGKARARPRRRVPQGEGDGPPLTEGVCPTRRRAAIETATPGRVGVTSTAVTTSGFVPDRPSRRTISVFWVRPISTASPGEPIVRSLASVSARAAANDLTRARVSSTGSTRPSGSCSTTPAGTNTSQRLAS